MQQTTLNSTGKLMKKRDREVPMAVATPRFECPQGTTTCPCCGSLPPPKQNMFGCTCWASGKEGCKTCTLAPDEKRQKLEETLRARKVDKQAIENLLASLERQRHREDFDDAMKDIAEAMLYERNVVV
jgi:hypothetical protein